MKLKITSLAIGLAILSGCSSNDDMADRLEALENQRAANEAAQLEKSTVLQEKELEALPEWVLSPPASDSSGFYGVGIAQSKQLNHSRRAARLQAEFELAKQTGQELSGSERSFEQGGASGEVNTQTTFLIDQIVDSIPVVGYQIVSQKLTTINGQFHAYTLLKLPYEEFNKALQQLKAKSNNNAVQKQFDDLERRLGKRRAEKEKATQAEHNRELELIEARTKALNPSTETKNNSTKG
ncbi:LPP20 family lipoprotein [Pseudoalteromonas sp. AC163]|uniref:LPP20 family lipoprotein n=1 Tax=Pseudoalteromonas sp. AC163 TaxID=1055790 RepID=UPI00042417E2|nr:LPP20 family lipoprotein [Pseudoalteromonas sp. AC163]